MPLNLEQDVVIRTDPKLPAQAGIAQISESEIQALDLPPFAKTGLWPNRRPPAVAGRGDETASASREPWVDANGYQAGYLRAIYPNRPPVLAYLPDKLEDRVVPYDSLELALIEAWVAGGNYIMAMEPHYREVVAGQRSEGDRGLESTRPDRSLVAREDYDVPAAFVSNRHRAGRCRSGERGDRESSIPAERLSCSGPGDSHSLPCPAEAAGIGRCQLKAPDAEQVKKIMAHPEAGTTLVVATAPTQQWWKVAGLKHVRTERDRDFYTLGKGQVVAYKRPIADPSEFALDVIDVITHSKRAVRIWNAPAVIALYRARCRTPGQLRFSD